MSIKKVLLVIVSLLLSFSLIGCGQSSGSSTQTATKEKKITKPELKEYVEKVDEKIIEVEKVYNELLNIKENKIVINNKHEYIYRCDSNVAEINKLVKESSSLKDIDIVKLHNECTSNYLKSMITPSSWIVIFSEDNKWNLNQDYLKKELRETESSIEKVKQLKDIYIKNRDKILNETIYEN